ADGTVHDLDLPYTAISSVEAAGDAVVFVGASPVAEPAVVRLRLDGVALAGEPEVLRPPRDLGLDPAWFSFPEPIDFPTSGGRTAHGLFYPPTNPEVTPPEGELPPLLVLIHGGPTSAARPMLQLRTQYWTSRGFAVVDVNYGGSTGYGRALGRVGARRRAARGYPAQAPRSFRGTLAAGARHYGGAGLEAQAPETHKFESRYLDSLIGPYPQRRDLYVERSPIHHLEGFD